MWGSFLNVAYAEGTRAGGINGTFGGKYPRQKGGWFYTGGLGSTKYNSGFGFHFGRWVGRRPGPGLCVGPRPFSGGTGASRRAAAGQRCSGRNSQQFSTGDLYDRHRVPGEELESGSGEDVRLDRGRGAERTRSVHRNGGSSIHFAPPKPNWGRRGSKHARRGRMVPTSRCAYGARRCGPLPER